MITLGSLNRLNTHVLVRLAIRLLMLAVVFAFVAWLVPGIDVHGGFGWLVWIAFLFSIVNAVIGTILRLITLPLIIITLGLFLFVINAALVAITAGLSSHLDCDSFGAALLGGALIALFSWIGELLLPARRRHRAHA
jgi:putative membrane protein